MALKKINYHTKIGVLLIVVLSLNNYGISAQYLYDFGFGGGVSGYSGEVSNQPFAHPGTDLSVFLRSNYSSRFAFRVGLDKGTVSGHTDDVLRTFPGAQGICNFGFATEFTNAEVLTEVNFFPYPFQKKVMNSSNFTPFAFVGAGMTTYEYIKEDKHTAMIIPFGVGAKWLFGKQWGVQVQFKAVKMFADDFDTFPLNDPFDFGEGGMHRDDWLYTTTIMLTYSYGEDIWDCNCPGGYKRKRRR